MLVNKLTYLIARRRDFISLSIATLTLGRPGTILDVQGSVQDGSSTPAISNSLTK